MNTFILGIKPANQKWLQMKAIYDACEAANIDIPEEVDKFFEGETPDEKGIVVDLYVTKPEHECIIEYKDDDYCGWEIEVNKIPTDIKIIRIIQS